MLDYPLRASNYLHVVLFACLSIYFAFGSGPISDRIAVVGCRSIHTVVVLLFTFILFLRYFKCISKRPV